MSEDTTSKTEDHSEKTGVDNPAPDEQVRFNEMQPLPSAHPLRDVDQLLNKIAEGDRPISVPRGVGLPERFTPEYDELGKIAEAGRRSIREATRYVQAMVAAKEELIRERGETPDREKIINELFHVDSPYRSGYDNPNPSRLALIQGTSDSQVKALLSLIGSRTKPEWADQLHPTPLVDESNTVKPIGLTPRTGISVLQNLIARNASLTTSGGGFDSLAATNHVFGLRENPALGELPIDTKRAAARITVTKALRIPTLDEAGFGVTIALREPTQGPGRKVLPQTEFVVIAEPSNEAITAMANCGSVE